MMKRNMIILGILLIAGLLLMGPVSATTVIGKGSKTVTSDYGYNKYKWTTYKYSTYNVQMVLTRDNYYENYLGGYSYFGTDKYVVDIVRASSSKVKVVQSIRYSDEAKTYKFWNYYSVKGGNAVTFYNTETFKYWYLKVYLW